MPVSNEGQNDRHAWAATETEDLGGGVYRIPLPLPGDALHAVNVYAIVGPDGVDLIDSGMALVQARDKLTAAMARLGFGLGDIRNFFITHVHQDHYTLAVELRTTLAGKISLGAGERLNMEAIREAQAGRKYPGFIEMLPGMGAADLSDKVRQFFDTELSTGLPATFRWEDPDEWLTDGTLLDLGQRTLHAIHTPGHTAGHVVFHDEAGSLLFAGDHVLPHITPSIGFQPDIRRMALQDFLVSLQLMLKLPDSRLLPAHGPVTESTHARVNELLEHHETRLAQTLDTASAGPVTPRQAADGIPWTRRKHKFADLDPMSKILAIGETAAHLEVLVARGELARLATADGIAVYASPASSAANPPE
jgi:glyoxylase-like metal-dependent hydrolase (beta-lactamase superfamily II)